MRKSIRLLGIRGIPGKHGGFETFAERLALYLAARDWRVTVYCQEEERRTLREESWNGVRLVHVPVPVSGSGGSILFDWKSAIHASREPGLVFTLGYNTAFLGGLYRLRKLVSLVNMDGIEWRRAKWSAPVKLWFLVNEALACRLANHLVADHPAIQERLASRVPAARISMIPYGADRIEIADESLIAPFGIEPGGYSLVVARPEPENSILEIVRGYCARPRGCKLVVLGNYDPSRKSYPRRVLDAAGDDVLFLGAIYERPVLDALRFHAKLYLHGHQVGGTNPSLVEALGAGCPVLAHDNRFNRWVAGSAAHYFRDAAGVDAELDAILTDSSELRRMRQSGAERFHQTFRWEEVLESYETLLLRLEQRTRA